MVAMVAVDVDIDPLESSVLVDVNVVEMHEPHITGQLVIAKAPTKLGSTQPFKPKS